ncbi:MAG TPA: hypothetical protein VGH86_11075 [Phenylobacterium sp.]
MPYEIPKWIWDAVVVLVVASAIWRGDRDERIAAISLAVGVVLSKAVYSHEGLQTEWGVFIVDLVLLGILTWLALTSHRYWPIFGAAFQFLAVIIHLARIADKSLGGWAYISAEILFGYMLAAAIAIGTLNTWRARRDSAMADDPAAGPSATRR